MDIQLCFIIITALGAGVKGGNIAPLPNLSLYRHPQDFIRRVVGQSDDFKVALFAGFRVFDQNFIPNFDLFNWSTAGEGVATICIEP